MTTTRHAQAKDKTMNMDIIAYPRKKEKMNDKKKQKIRKAVSKMMVLATQMEYCAEFAPIHYAIGNTGRTIQVDDNKSFEDVLKAYDIPESEVRRSWNGDVFHKYADLERGFELCVVLWKNEEGYEEGEDDVEN